MMVNVGVTCFISIAIILTYTSKSAGVTSERVVLSPRHVHFNNRDYNAQEDITCNTTSPLSRCEFKVFKITNWSKNQNKNYWQEVSTKGECVMTLKASELVQDYNYIVTCRVRSADNDWEYASMSVYKSTMNAIGLPRTAYDQVVLPGSKLNLAVRGESTLSRCDIKLPGSPLTHPFYISYGFCYSSKDFYGDGQNACWNTCGITNDKVTEEHNGIFFLILESTYNKDVTFINVIVAKLPSSLTLSHEMSDNSDGSVTLEATCTVSGSRPAPDVTWTLDGQVVRSEAVRSVAAEKWVWPHEEQTVKQNMTLALNASHAGKEVSCSATHPTFNITIYNSFKIRSGLGGTTGQAASSHPSSTSSLMFSDGMTATTPSAALSTSSNQGTATDPTSVSEKLGGDAKCQVADRSVKGYNVVIGVLSTLLIILVILVVIYAQRNKLYCFSASKENRDDGSVEYRRSLDASFKYEETRNPTVSSIDRSSAVTGLEYAEIRVSMVQRCVDKLQGNTNSGTPSAETGEVSDNVSRPNSLYLSYDEKV